MEKSDLQVGQTVLVLDGHGRRAEPVNGTVVKIGRVWVDVHREGQSYGWRFRLDTQHDGGFGYGTSFYTLAQWEQRQREAAAQAFLRDQGVTLDYDSSWHGRIVELATLLGWTA